MSPLVEFRNVSYTINGTKVLADVSFELMAGETLVLLGRSGAGKTTALRLVNGLLLPTSGDVLVEGQPIQDWNLIELRRRIGYVIQDIGLFPHLTVAGNIGIVPGLLGWDRERITARVDELLTAVGLPPNQFASRFPRELSGGQQQRVGVIRALAADPDLLLFDEPFGALDPVTRLEVQLQFLELRRRFQKSSLFVTHDIHEALALGSRIGLMYRGELVVLLPPEQFQRAEHEEAGAFLRCLEVSYDSGHS